MFQLYHEVSINSKISAMLSLVIAKVIKEKLVKFNIILLDECLYSSLINLYYIKIIKNVT